MFAVDYIITFLKISTIIPYTNFAVWSHTFIYAYDNDDNDPKHTAKILQKLLDEKKRGSSLNRKDTTIAVLEPN